MAGLWDVVPQNGTLVPVTLAQFQQDLLNNSDQTTRTGWQVTDSYFNFLSFAIERFAKYGITVTQEELLLYYVSDATLNLAVIAAPVAMNAQLLKQPWYARVNYGLNTATGQINRVGVHITSRWYFNSTPLTNLPAGAVNESFYLALDDAGTPLVLSDGTLITVSSQ